MRPLIVKVCGLTRPEDAAFCARAGVDWTGFIFHPASPRGLTPAAAAALRTGPAARVGVFVRQSPEEVRRIMKIARLDWAQLHGGQSAEFARRVGPERVILVRWPEAYAGPDELAREAADLASAARWLLFDAGRSGGGHGRPLDLSLLAAVPGPWLLAGGLDAAKVSALAGQAPPGLAGFDFNSGVEEAPGLKNHDQIQAAVRAVRALSED